MVEEDVSIAAKGLSLARKTRDALIVRLTAGLATMMENVSIVTHQQ